jgi:hypothetical protein
MCLLRAGFSATPIQRPNVEPLPRQLLAAVGQMAVLESITRTDVPMNLSTSKMLSPAARRQGVPELVDPVCHLAGEFALERDVFVHSPLRCALALPRPCVLVTQTFGFGLRDRRLLDEHALPLVPPARAAEANHDR